MAFSKADDPYFQSHYIRFGQVLEIADGAVTVTLGVLGVLRCRGGHSRRFGYFYLYSGAHGKGFGD